MRIGIVIIKKSVDKENIIVEGDNYGIIFYGSLINRLVKQGESVIGNINDVPTTINQYGTADINCMLTISKLKLDKSETLSLIADLTNNIIYQEPDLNSCGYVLEQNLKMIEEDNAINEKVVIDKNYEDVVRTMPMSKFY